MSHTVSIQQASAHLDELIRSLGPRDEIVVSDNEKPVARIVPDHSPRKREFGACRGMLEIIDYGDDVILDHFKEYLP